MESLCDYSQDPPVCNDDKICMYAKICYCDHCCSDLRRTSK
jgi:hypothetical protein